MGRGGDTTFKGQTRERKLRKSPREVCGELETVAQKKRVKPNVKSG